MPQHNAGVVRDLLAGRPGPVRDAVLLNAGAALAVHAASPATVDEALADGIARARGAVDSGEARVTLDAGSPPARAEPLRQPRELPVGNP